MLGILAWLVAGGAMLKDRADKDYYTGMSYKRAVANNDYYYYDGKGRKHLTTTDQLIYIEVDSRGHKVIKDLKRHYVIIDITAKEKKERVEKAYKDAKEKGELVYFAPNEKESAPMFMRGIYRDVETRQLVFENLLLPGSSKHQIYLPLKPTYVDKNGVQNYERDKYGTYIIQTENGEWYKTDWRGYRRYTCHNNSHYFHIEGEGYETFTDEGGTFDICYALKDDAPWAIEYRYRELKKIKGFWHLYPDGNGGYTREKKWYHEGYFLDYGKDVEVK